MAPSDGRQIHLSQQQSAGNAGTPFAPTVCEKLQAIQGQADCAIGSWTPSKGSPRIRRHSELPQATSDRGPLTMQVRYQSPPRPPASEATRNNCCDVRVLRLHMAARTLSTQHTTMLSGDQRQLLR